MAGPNRQLSAQEISSISGPIRVTGEGFGQMHFNNGAELLRWQESHPGTHLWYPQEGASPVTDSRETTNESTGEVNQNTQEEGNRSFGEWLSDFWNKNYAWQYQDFKQNDPIFGQRRLDNFNRVYRQNPNFMNNWDILNNNLEMINIGGLGIPNKLSLSQLYGFGRDLYNGKNVLDSWYGLNTGFFTEDQMAKHPILASGINLAFDIGVPWATSKIRNVTRFANALRFNRFNKGINSKLPKSEIPYSTNNLNNYRKFPSIYDNPMGHDEAIDLYANSTHSPQLDEIANQYYKEEIFPRLTPEYPQVPEGTSYPIGNWDRSWNNRELDLGTISENIPTDLYSLIPNSKGGSVRVAEPITLIHDYGDLRKMGFGYIEDRFKKGGGVGVFAFGTEGEGIPFVLPKGIKNQNTTAIHEMASHGTDAIIPIKAQQNYEQIGRLLGLKDNPWELRATINELRYQLKIKGANIDNLTDGDLITLFKQINGYSGPIARRAMSILKIPEEKLAEYIRYMLKYLPAATPFYFMDNQSEGQQLSPRYEPSDNTQINNQRLMYNKGGKLNKFKHGITRNN